MLSKVGLVLGAGALMADSIHGYINDYVFPAETYYPMDDMHAIDAAWPYHYEDSNYDLDLIIENTGYLVDKATYDNNNAVDPLTLTWGSLITNKASGFVMVDGSDVHTLNAASNAMAVASLEAINTTAIPTVEKFWMRGGMDTTNFNASEVILESVQLSELEEHVGWISDNMCWAVAGYRMWEPSAHPIKCLMLTSCYPSGFMLTQEVNDTDHRPLFRLDAKGNTAVKTYVNDTHKIDTEALGMRVYVYGRRGPDGVFQVKEIMDWATFTAAKTLVTHHNGFISDIMCWDLVGNGLPPPTHPLNCLMLETCYPTGFTYLLPTNDPNVFAPEFNFDKRSNRMIFDWIEADYNVNNDAKGIAIYAHGWIGKNGNFHPIDLMRQAVYDALDDTHAPSASPTSPTVAVTSAPSVAVTNATETSAPTAATTGNVTQLLNSSTSLTPSFTMVLALFGAQLLR